MSTTIATCDLCDAHKSDTSGSFRVLPPLFREFGGVAAFSGPVVTVKCFEDNSLVKAAVDSQGWIDTAAGRVGQVLVVDGGASLRKALLGGNLGAEVRFCLTEFHRHVANVCPAQLAKTSRPTGDRPHR